MPSNCMDCEHHLVVPDPDPTDWFCVDDEAVLCRLTGPNRSKFWASGKPFAHRPVTVSCRPHRTRDECRTPNWCPLLHKTGETPAKGRE